MKMIITCRRNPAMTRGQFFHHLRHVHWPLIRQHPAVEAALGGYIQNHALGSDGPPRCGGTSVAIERDSVIELFFPGPEALAALGALPEYAEHIRPDEATFNDLPGNIMVKVDPELLFAASSVGRCKRFDFLAAAPGADRADVVAALRSRGRELALDPAFTAEVDRLVLNVAHLPSDGGGFGTGEYAAVVETWAGSLAALSAAAMACDNVAGVDAAASFCVLATEFEMIRPLPALAGH